MPAFTFTSPEGKSYTVNGPDGATKEQAFQILQSRLAAPKPAAPDPTEGNSFLDNTLAGIGSDIVDLGLRGKQVGAQVADFFNPKAGQSRADAVQAEIDAKRKLDAPLMDTAGGKIGAIGGKALPAAAAAFLPGGQGFAGSMIIGGLSGLAEPVGTGESSVKNALFGVGGGASGYGVGKLVGAGAKFFQNRAAEQEVANAGRDAVASTAKDAGYVIPPSQTNPTLGNRTLEGLAGKISTGQSASVKNQAVTNRLAAGELGLPTDQPITKEALSTLRAQAGRAYDAVKSAGPLQADQQYAQDLAAITQKYQGAAKDFPELAKNEVADIVASIDKPGFGADSAVDALKILRERATNAYGKGDKTLGKAYRDASDALEGLVERNLSAQGNPDLLKQFQDARQLIAKTYSVEGALNNSTGNVSAVKLARQLDKGKPLSGNLKDVAQVGQAFPKAVQDINSSIPGVSPLDFFGAGGLSLATGNPLALLLAGTRPVARSVILSRPYQNMLATPKYGGNALLNLLGSDAGRIGLQVAGQTSPQLLKQ